MRRLPYLILLLIVIAAPAFGQVINTIAGNGTAVYGGDSGPATAAGLVQPWGLVVTSSGNKYISDFSNNRIRKVSSTGVISTLTGTGTGGYTGDGGAAVSAKINSPRGLAVDAAGNLYIADQNNHVIRKVSASGIISTVAGTGSSGYTGDGGAAISARLSYPQAVAIDRSGNLLITDLNYVVRKVNSSGIISTIAGTAGTPGYTGDGGPATAATFNNIYGICTDTAGNIYLADNWNHAIRKINTAGIVSTYAGTGTPGYTGDGGAAVAAQLNYPVGVVADSAGNVYIGDESNNVVRKITRTGIISTLAGTGASGYTGDRGYAILATLNAPTAVSCDGQGNVYVADHSNYVVRKIDLANRAPGFTSGAAVHIVMCESAPTLHIDSLLAIRDSNLSQTETWSRLVAPHHGTATGSFSAVSTDSVITPSGFSYTPTVGYSGTDSFKIKVSDGSLSNTIMVYVTVNPTPPLSPIGGPAYACTGRLDTLTDTASGGVWSVQNGNMIITSTGVVGGIATGMDTVFYSKVLAGCTNKVQKVITIYPTSTTISGQIITCRDHSITLTATPAGGVWTSVDTLATVNSGGLVTVRYPGFDTIVYTITNSCGVFYDRHPLTINDIVIPYVLISGTPGAVIRPGETDTLNVSTPGSTGIFTYQWEKNGIDVPGATNSYYIGNFANNDSITCLVYNVPCTFTAFGWIYIVVSDVSVSTINMQGAAMRLAPNPNKGNFTLQGTLPTTTNDARIEVANMLGQVVYSSGVTLQNGELKEQITLASELPEGMYLLHVITNEGTTVIRFAIQR